MMLPVVPSCVSGAIRVSLLVAAAAEADVADDDVAGVEAGGLAGDRDAVARGRLAGDGEIRAGDC